MATVEVLGSLPTAPVADAIQRTESLPTISFKDPNRPEVLDVLEHAATSLGVVRISDLPYVPPFTAIQRLFDHLRGDPQLAADLNATYPLRGVYKDAALRNPDADQKLTVDLSRVRVSRIPASLQERLGDDFVRILAFFDTIHDQIVPMLLEATSRVTGTDLAPVHQQQNVNYRLCDYAPLAHPTAARCGEHRDYGTVTILLQNGHAGLEYQTPSGAWVPISGKDVVVFWGWCAHVASHGKIRAAPHRVLQTAQGVRRNTAVVFVAPDLDAPLTPLVPGARGGNDGGACASPAGLFGPKIMRGDVTVGDFKMIVGRKWRHREGNAEDDGSAGNQDAAIREFLLQ